MWLSLSTLLSTLFYVFDLSISFHSKSIYNFDFKVKMNFFSLIRNIAFDCNGKYAQVSHYEVTA